MQLITRFAPSPTGYLHLGHVISMVYVFGISKSLGAKVLLRIEDHDRQRCRPEYEQAILDDMAWLGFYPDNWSEFSVAKSTHYRQSNRLDRYGEVLSVLSQKGKTYFCQCSRKQINESKDDGVDERRYPGWCRNKQLTDGEGRGVRFTLDEGHEQFIDQLRGKIVQDPSQQCGDFLLKERHGNFTYNFCAVVDDIDQGVNCIIRGEDILGCTGRQIALMRALKGNRPLLYFHHPLIVDQQGNKLSKRSFAEGIIHRRLSGESPECVLGEALYLIGILQQPCRVKAEQAIELLIHK